MQTIVNNNATEMPHKMEALARKKVKNDFNTRFWIGERDYFLLFGSFQGPNTGEFLDGGLIGSEHGEVDKNSTYGLGPKGCP